MRTLAFTVLVAIGACSGDTPDGPDTCTGNLYDKCVDEHDCTTGNCRPFGTIQVCTQLCSDTNPCPNDAEGHAVTCTNMLCVPAVANACELPG